MAQVPLRLQERQPPLWPLWVRPMTDHVQRSPEPATDRLAQAILDGRLHITGSDSTDKHGVHTWTLAVTVDPDGSDGQ